jgi:hypothetical protein
VAELEREEVSVLAPRGRGEQAPALGLTPLQQRVLELQRTAGNGAVGALLRARRRLARTPKLPGFSQFGDTCGAASMVTALFLWDIERASPSNAAVVHACDLVLTAKDTATANAAGKKFVQDVRAQAMTPGYTLGETEYQALAAGLALLYNGRAGMASSDIHALAKAIGFQPSGYGSGETLGQVLASDAVKNLAAGEVGQLNWVLRTGGGHAMLLGRHEDGTWFFSDQGASPAVGIQRPRYEELVGAVLAYAAGGSWLYAGNKQDMKTLPPVTGFTVLSKVQAFLNRGPSLITPGEELAEIDAGYTTSGEVIKAWDYHSRHETLAEAQAAIAKDPGGHGAVIVERPSGMFHIWKTNPIKDADNLKQTSIDTSDSSKMVLVARIKTFFSVWVVLSDASGKKSAPFEVKP